MRSANDKKGTTRILVVGQMPPPFSGQAVMIEKMLGGDYGEAIELVHVRMAFSKDTDDVGKPRFQKVFELLRVIMRVVHARFRYGAKVLYYPPANPSKWPVLRDVVILGTTRWLFQRTIFHFHAGGIAEYSQKLSAFMRFLFRFAYSKPDVAIRLSEFNPEDGKGLGAKQEFIVPNGILDEAKAYTSSTNTGDNAVPHILFIGVIREAKGVNILLEAGNILRNRGVAFHLDLMGAFEEEQFETQVQKFIYANGLADVVTFLGALTGREKSAALASADIFCFPSYFETFGLVLVEAMSFGLPIVATQAGGVRSVVEDGACGFLVPVGDPVAVATKLEALIVDPKLREAMGKAGRKRYLEHFTVDKYHHRLKHIFEAVAKDLAEADM